MIIDPDFLNHWKTQMLVIELDDKAAPLYVIALWGHCQTRRKDRFETLPPNALKAICRYDGDSERLTSALLACGFIRREGEAIVVHGWSEANAKLLANWENGKRGGRPPKDNPTPPAETHRKPNDNPDESDKSRVEESREKENKEAREANGKHPTEEDVIRHARTLHPPADELLARQWWNEMEGAGWYDRQKRPIHISQWKNAFNSTHYGARRVGHEIDARSRKQHASKPVAKQPNI